MRTAHRLMTLLEGTPPTAYYVDATGGSDSNSGLTPALAWQTIGKVNGASFAVIKQVLFKYGERFTGAALLPPTAGVAGAPIIFGAYGNSALAKPSISAMPVLASGWTNLSGNVWQHAATTQPLMVYVNGVRGTLKAGTGSLAAQGDWYWAANVLSVYSTSDPATNYTTPGVQAPQRNYAIDTNSKDYLSFINLDIQGGNDGGLYIHGSDHIVADGCDCHDNFNFGILTFASTASDVNHETVQNCLLHDNGRWGYSDGFGAAAGGGGNVLTNCDVYNNGWRVSGGSFATGGVYGDFSGGSISNCRIYANGLGDTTSALNHGIYIAASPSVPSGAPTIEHNTVYNNRSYGIQARASATIRYNECYGNETGGIIIGDGPAANAATLYYNLIHGNGRGVVVGKFGNTGNVTLVLENNTVYLNVLTTQVAAPSELKIADVLGGTLTVKNNIFYNNSTFRTYEFNKTFSAGYVLSNNDVFRTTGGNLVGYDTGNLADRTWASWLALGFETNSLNSDPLIVGSGSYLLQSGSPCINAGVDVGLTADYAGNALVGVPDIGAYEHG